MKKLVVIGAVSALVILCSCVAIVASSNHQANVQAAQTSEVQKLNKQLADTQNTQKLHDATNIKALSDAGQQILILGQQKAALCTQIKAAKLSQPLCK